MNLNFPQNWKCEHADLGIKVDEYLSQCLQILRSYVRRLRE